MKGKQIVVATVVSALVTVGLILGVTTNKTQEKKNQKESVEIAKEQETKFKDGEYFGEAQGYQSIIKVKVTIKDDKIFDIQIVSHNETPGYIDKAMKIIDSILKNGDLNVDSISGATVSSDAIKKAVAQALKQAVTEDGLASVNLEVAESNIQIEKSLKPIGIVSSNLIGKNDKIDDGVYYGSSRGYAGNISVKVTVKDGKITNIDILSHREDEPFFSKAKAVVNAMLGDIGKSVDTVSGATYSSRGLINAVKNAISKGIHKNNNVASTKDVGSIERPMPQVPENINPEIINNEEIQVLNNDKMMKDGTYDGTAKGYGGDIKVRVTVADGNIVNIVVLSHNEDQPYYQEASVVIGKLLGKADKKVDTVSGATFSSRGIIRAVKDAISKSLINKPVDEDTPIKQDDSKLTDNIKEEIARFYNNDVLKDGTYIGFGRGYAYQTKKIKTVVTVKDGEIFDVQFAPNETYPDAKYQEQALEGSKYFVGKDGRQNLAKALAYYEKMFTIKTAKQSDTKEIAKSLLGQKYSDKIDNLESLDKVNRISKLALVVKDYAIDNYNMNDMLDSVSGATISFGGISESIKDAMSQAAHDNNAKQDIKFLDIKMPQSKYIEMAYNKPIDFSDLVLELTKTDGTKEEVGVDKFDEYGIKIVNDYTGKELKQGELLEGYNQNEAIHIRVIHEGSLRHDEGVITLGNFSKDYILDIQYSLDGKKWFHVDNISMRKDEKSISHTGHSANAPANYEYEKIKLRTVSAEGNIYEYEPEKIVISGSYAKYRQKATYDNPNADEYVYVMYSFSGTEKDKKQVESSENQGSQGGQDTTDTEDNNQNTDNAQEIDVGGDKIAISLDDTSTSHDWVENKAISPVRVTLSDSDAELLSKIENLPRGLSFDGSNIVGTPIVNENEWDESYYGGRIKEYTFKIKARKGNVLLVRTYKWYVSRDKDKDGVPDTEEFGIRSTQDVFNPSVDRTALVSDGKKLTVEDYKTKIKNLPSDDSVIVTVKKDADYTQIGVQSVTLEFAVPGLDKKGVTLIKVNVRKVVEEREVEVGGDKIGISLDNNSGGEEWIQNKAIKNVTVTVQDSEATIDQTIENLPRGLIFDGSTISGKPIVLDNEWDPTYYGGNSKEYVFKVKARKGNVVLVRNYRWYVHRDKDKDGIADGEEYGMNKDAFTPTIDRSAIISNGKKVTMEDIKAKIKNLPDDGSVTINITQDIDYTTAGEKTLRVEFVVDGLEKKSKNYLKVDVKKPIVEEREVEVGGDKIGISLDNNSGGEEWIQNKAIKNVTVTVQDSEATIDPVIENLPKGLTFDGSTISGKPIVADDEWDPNYYGGNSKEYIFKVKARKGNIVFVRNYRWYVYKDRDKDGIADGEEYGISSTQDVFNAVSDKTPIIAKGKRLTVADYKTRIKNLPEDDSVIVTVKKDADYTQRGEQSVILEFEVPGLTKIGKTLIKVDVRQPIVD